MQERYFPKPEGVAQPNRMVTREERLKEIVAFWTEAYPKEDITLRSIRALMGAPIALDTISKLIDKIKTEDPTFTIPLRGKKEAKPRRKMHHLDEMSIENVTRGIAENHPEIFASLTEAARAAGIHKKAGKVAPLLEAAGIRYRKIDVEDHTPSRGIHSRFTKYYVLRSELPRIVEILRSTGPANSQKAS